MRGNLQAVRIVCLGVVLTIGFALALRCFPGRAELAENNFQANLIRLQSFFFNAPPHTVLVGSSITGRLLPRYFSDSPLAPVINLGLDGSGPALGLDLALKRPPPLLLVEVNLLLKPRASNDAVLVDISESFAFRLSRRIPILRAQSRPSSLLYSWLKTSSHHGQEVAPDPLASPARELPPLTNAPLTLKEFSPAQEKIRSHIRALQQAGCTIVLVRFPAGKSTLNRQHPAALFADALAQEFQLTQMDLAAEFEASGQPISYTDGLHLTPASAEQVTHFLAAKLVHSRSLRGPENIEKTLSRRDLVEKLPLKP